MDTVGSPIPLAYGYAWVTGKRDAYWMMQNTGYSHTDFHRVGRWFLGHGEWDGCSELWINDVLVWTGNVPTTPPANSNLSGQNWVECLDYPQPMVFNFHAGCDSVIGSGLEPSSSGPDQGVDVLCAQFPSAIQPLCYSRIAYYMLMRKQPIQNQTNTHQNDPTQWTDINPIGLWRTRKCRLFDGSGTQTGYAFTTNPAWHIVDVLCFRKLFPDYKLDLAGGPDQLPEAVSARFNWESIYESAQYYDGFLANGRRRFAGNYSFSSATSLQAVLSQMLLCCRSFLQESNGQIYLICDKPRPVSFVFSRANILPGSLRANDQDLTTAPNRYVASFRDILVPACATIASITSTAQGNPVVVTEEPHCLNAGDRIAIGGTGTVYDGNWQVYSVPPATNVGTPEEIDPTTFTMVRKGANYPASVGAGGAVGLLYSRFKNRTPIFDHVQNQLARGMVGLGIARIRNRVKQTLDFATGTYDQASRITRYERDRRLGLDQSPYVTPPALELRTSMFATDVNGDFAAALRPGDHVQLDDTASYPYQGDYEVMEPQTFYPPAADPSSKGGSLQRSITSGTGEIAFTLRQYNEAWMYDTSDDAAAGWPSVPGSDPGNDTGFTSVDLANGGNFVFFVGQLPSGSQFQLPSTGYPTGNLLAWAGPAGANVAYHSAHFIQLCSVDATRMLIQQISDGSTVWSGDVNYAALTWLSPDVTFQSGGLTWIQFTLLGGENILFGQGVLADGTTIELPPGFTAAQCFAVAFPHDQVDSGNIMFLIGAYVDSSMVVHLNTCDDSGHVWHGNAAVLVFAWQNNMGTVVSETVGGNPWIHIPLSNGKVFGVGCAKSMANGATLALPAAAQGGITLEPMVGSSDGTYEAGSNHAQGVGTCYLDDSDVVHISFNDGSGDTWPGQADVFAAYCVGSTAPPVIVVVSPNYPSVGQASVQAFTAEVLGNANQAVTWSVDGIAGGSASIGTIDANGNYTAPLQDGQHTITATSVADSTASGSATVTVTGAQGGIVISINGSTLQINAGAASLSITNSSGWQVTAGSVTLTAASSGSPYNVAVSWTGVKAVSPNGTQLSYTDGTENMASNQTGVLYLYDPTEAGGSGVGLATGGSAPTGALILLNITTVPAMGGSQTYPL